MLKVNIQVVETSVRNKAQEEAAASGQREAVEAKTMRSSNCTKSERVACQRCGKKLSIGETRRCTRCGRQPYCSRACAGGDWSQHKEHCTKQNHKLLAQKEYKKVKMLRGLHLQGTAPSPFQKKAGTGSGTGPTPPRTPHGIRWARGPDAPNAVGFSCRRHKQQKQQQPVPSSISRNVDQDQPNPLTPDERSDESMPLKTHVKTHVKTPAQLLSPSAVAFVASGASASLGKESPYPRSPLPNRSTPGRGSTPGTPGSPGSLLELQKKFRALVRKAENGADIHVHDLKLCLNLYELETQGLADHGILKHCVETALQEQSAVGGKKFRLADEGLAELKSWKMFFKKKHRKSHHVRSPPRTPGQGSRHLKNAQLPTARSLFQSP